MTTQRPFVIAVSHATRAARSWASMPSSTASETWSQILSGWPSVTDSDVSRNDREELNEVVTRGDDNRAVEGRSVGETWKGFPLRAVVLPAVLRLLAEQLGLERKDVVEHAVDPAPLEPVVRDDSRMLEVTAQRGAEHPVDGELLGAVRRQVHAVPRTSTRPCSLTRTCTRLSATSP